MVVTKYHSRQPSAISRQLSAFVSAKWDLENAADSMAASRENLRFAFVSDIALFDVFANR